MSKLVESLMKDAIAKVKTPEFHSAVVEPLFLYLFDMLFPYLIAFVGLWVLTFLGVAAIIVFLVTIVT